MMTSFQRFALAPLVATAFGGCQLGQWVANGFKVGPNYETPAAPAAETWIDYQAPATQPDYAKTTDFANWWRVFGDPVLDSLVLDCYEQNLTLRQAGERVSLARSGRDIAIGNLFPQFQQLSGGVSVNKSTNPSGSPFVNEWYQNANGGLNIGWEIDFWGRYRRAIEQSDATLDATVADFDNVMVLVIAETARNYIQYRTFQERLFLARQNAEIQRQAFELAQNNFRAGAATERDMQQARQVYEQTRSTIPQFELGIRVTNDTLCVLLGIPVQDLSERLGVSGVIPMAPLETAIGIPADLLRRRPDVRRAERFAAAQSAQIGVVTSDLYPRFALNGSIGLSAEYIGGMWATPGSVFGSFGPSFRWDILNYGRIESSIKGQESRFREALLGYQQAVLQANREAEDAIAFFAKAKEREVYLKDSVTAAERTVQITYDQYRAGTVDFTPVFIFELTLTQQQDSLAQARGDIGLSLVDLYRALGGGWQSHVTEEPIVGPDVEAPTTQRATTRPQLIPTTTPRP